MPEINHTMTCHSLLRAYPRTLREGASGREFLNNTKVLGRAVKTLCLLVVAISSAGCFDAEALVHSRQKMAVLARLEEIDLGEFRVTLPKPAAGASIAELRFHVFGRVANSDLDRVQKALENQGPQFRHELLLAVRQLQVSDLEDPQLQTLRSHIENVMNDALSGEPLQSVGFYSFAYANF